MEKQVFAGIDVGGTFVKIGLVSSDGEIIAKDQIPTRISQQAEDMLLRAAATIKKLSEAHGECTVSGVGIGTAGQVNVEKGILFEAPNMPNWKNVPMSQILSDELSLPVILDNDANVAAWGEFGYGAGTGSRFMLMVTLGTGVGGGLILDGKPFRGASDTAGEFGHNTLDFNGWQCGCGRKGCVEAYVGTKGILRQVREKLAEGYESVLAKIDPDKLAPVDLSVAADNGDELAIEVLAKTGEYLGEGLADMVNLFNLDCVVVGGGVAKAGDRILRPAKATVLKSSLRIPVEVVKIVPAKLGNDAGLVGAAWLAAFQSGLV